MRLNIKRELFPVLILAAGVTTGIYFYPSLPNAIPSRFDLNGRANGWMSKPDYFIMMGGVYLFVYLLLTFLPFIDPLKRNIEPKYNVVLLLRDFVLAFLAAVFFFTMQAANQGKLRFRLVGLAVGLLIFLLGNYMPKIPQNWFFGIRTPWTLSSETIWKKTHLLGGWLFAMAGLLFMISGFLKISETIPLAAVLAAAAAGAVYSLYLFKVPGRNDRTGRSAA